MGFFGREKIPVPPHPRREPRIDLPLCLESLEQVFDGCVDFSHRAVDLGGDPAKKLTLCYIGGMVRMERVSDYVLRPLAQDKALAVGNLAGAIGRIRDSALDEVVLLDTTALPPEKQIEKIKVLSVAPVLAEAVARIYSDKPVSTLFV